MNQGLHNWDTVGCLIAEVGMQHDEPVGRPHDTETQARCRLRLASSPGVTTGDQLEARR
jgi:hypothetical protein